MDLYSYHRFEVEIKDIPFEVNAEISYPQTAVVSFFDVNEELMITKDYGYLPVEDIYKQINTNKSLEVDYCYVPNFSFTKYRTIYKIGEDDLIELKSISAQNTFFSTKREIDFSHIVVNDYSDFKNSLFVGNLLNFSNATVKNNFSINDAFIYIRFIDFSNTVFKHGEVNFKNTIFRDGEKRFQYTNFGTGDVNFTNVDFGDGNVSFVNSFFNNGKVLFKVARFGKGDIDFHYSIFTKGDVSFENTNFGDGIVNFKTVDFGVGRVNFNRSVFGAGNILFNGTTLKGKLSFKKAHLGEGMVNFELAELIKADVIFEKADTRNISATFFKGKFKSISLQHCHILNHLDLRVKRCNQIDLSDTISTNIIDFKPYDAKVDIKCLNISGMRLLGNIHIDWKENKVLDIISNQTNTTNAQKAYQFFILKESFNKIGQYDDEDVSYVWFKRYQAKDDYEKITEKSLLKKIYYTPVHWFRNLLFDHAGLYATSPIRVLLSMVVAILFFGVLYSLMLVSGFGSINSSIGGTHAEIGILGRSIFHSGITFFTIGYGDFYPMGIVRWLSNIEGFVGVVLTSYFTVAFVRKILR